MINVNMIVTGVPPMAFTAIVGVGERPAPIEGRPYRRGVWVVGVLGPAEGDIAR